MQDLTCRDMRNGDEDAVSQLIRNSFLRFIARDYKPEGLEIFLQETSAEGIAFKDAGVERTYKERTRRMADAIQLKVPDRVPIAPHHATKRR